MSITHDFAMKTIDYIRYGRGLPQDSPVDHVRKTLSRGDCDWPGYDAVYIRLQDAAHNMAMSSVYLSDEHVMTMAIMGCGHEETMKAELHRCRGRGFLK